MRQPELSELKQFIALETAQGSTLMTFPILMECSNGIIEELAEVFDSDTRANSYGLKQVSQTSPLTYDEADLAIIKMDGKRICVSSILPTTLMSTFGLNEGIRPRIRNDLRSPDNLPRLHSFQMNVQYNALYYMGANWPVGLFGSLLVTTPSGNDAYDELFVRLSRPLDRRFEPLQLPVELTLEPGTDVGLHHERHP